MDAVIIDAVRTPRGKGKEDGALAGVAPVEMLRQLYAALDERTPGATESADQLTVGCVGQVGAQGGHVALVSKIYAGLPEAMPAHTINNYCVSSLTAAGQAARAITAGEHDVAFAGGVESMSQVPFMGDKATYYMDPSLSVKTRFLPVAVSADVIATLEDFDRGELDRIAVDSHHRAGEAEAAGRGRQSRIPVRADDGSVLLDRDELVRPGLTVEKAGAMPPAFEELGAVYDKVAVEAIDGLDAVAHRHSIANAPGVSDGAGMALLASDEGAAKLDVTPRARVRAYAEAGGHPVLSLLAGFTAMDKALAKAGMTLDDIDRFEVMEAFSATPLKFFRDWQVDPAKVNVNGGHLAKGHPMGASGAILLSSLLDAMEDDDAATGLVVAAGASGIGSAMIVERGA